MALEPTSAAPSERSCIEPSSMHLKHEHSSCALTWVKAPQRLPALPWHWLNSSEASTTLSAKPVSPPFKRLLAKIHNLIIDGHAPGNAADRNRDDRLAALRIDDGDVVAEAVGDEHLAFIARERDPPRALA